MEIKNNSERAKWILNIFYLMILVYMVSILSTYFQYDMLILNDFTQTEAEANDHRQMTVAFIHLAIHIAAATFFIMWFRRAYNNLHTVGVKLEFEEQWACYSWFIPILNLFRPFSIMQEVWTKTQVSSDAERVESNSLLEFWWAAWIANTFISRISGKMPIDTLDELKTSSVFGIISDTVGLSALILAIMVVRKIADFEKVFFASNHKMSIEDHLVDGESL